MASSTDELTTITDQLSDYFSKLSLNYANPANPLPSFEDYAEFIVYDSILTDALSGVDRAASYSNGALIDTAHLASAIIREFNMRTKGKVAYFADAEDDAAKVTDYMNVVYGKYLNYYRGTSPEQGKE